MSDIKSDFREWLQERFSKSTAYSYYGLVQKIFDKNCFKKGNVVYNDECVAEYPFAKKRWTPAEANEWLHDGNDNFVVITFKK